ncbi:MAG: hypothetical protein ACI9MR_000824 [Myxococcota bacterium]|jgi:hypothetical protein
MLSCSRNMTIVRTGESLTIINSMRLSADGLSELDKLGKVEHVIRIAGFHGMDDPFYKDHYEAKVHVVEGMVYAAGFDNGKENVEHYFKADAELTDESELPIDGARLFQFKTTKVSEGMILLEREGGILVTGDSLQNWNRTDRFFSLPARLMMKMMGFIKPHNLGPGWVKTAKPAGAEIRSVLEMPFEHILPAHGEEVIGDAKSKFQPAIDRAFAG